MAVSRGEFVNTMDQDDDVFSQTSQNSDSEISTTDHDQEFATTDPLLRAIDELEGRIVAALDNFKQHPGTKSITTMNTSTTTSIHTELQEMLRPVLEIAAHIGPATARSHASFRPSVDAAIEEVYTHLNSDLILPVLLESAQSDTIPAKRAASLNFFVQVWKEYRQPKSYLDITTLYGTEDHHGSMHHKHHHLGTNVDAMLNKQRQIARSNKTAELLRYWVEGSTACTIPGAFTDVQSDISIASRAVISASALLKPAFKHISEKISSADDAGALRLFIPVMRMIGGVLRRLFATVSSIHKFEMNQQGQMQLDSLRSSCIKFLEIVILCFSTRTQPGSATGSAAIKTKPRNQANVSDDFALDDLPIGHPVITKQSLEEIGEEAFTILRGFATIGGQLKVDPGVIRDVMLSFGIDANGNGSTPSAQIVSIIRPAALSYLEIESNITQNATDENPFPTLDRSHLETDFDLCQKSYALTINALSMLAINRPIFFKDSASCLARRAVDPYFSNTSIQQHPMSSLLSKSAIMAIHSQLKASCLTLLRNSLSVTTGSSSILYDALSSDLCAMKVQADKALSMSRQAIALKSAGRAARNRAAIFYEWDQSKTKSLVDDAMLSAMEDVTKKRQRAGDDALERMRAAKAARGLGHGIQLPTSMTDAVELILLNLSNLPSSKVSASLGDKKSTQQQQSDRKKRAMTLDLLIDAILTNGASLETDESRWYGRDGGSAWIMDISNYISDDEDDDIVMKSDNDKEREPAPVSVTLASKTMQVAMNTIDGKESDKGKIFIEQCRMASSDAFQRILTNTSSSRNPLVSDFGNKIAARLAWTLEGVEPLKELKEMNTSAKEGILAITKKFDNDVKRKEELDKLKTFSDRFPLVNTSFVFDAEIKARAAASIISKDEGSGDSMTSPNSSLSNRILHEAYLNSISVGESKNNYSGDVYGEALDSYVSIALSHCEKTDEKPSDNHRKRLALVASSVLPHQLAVIPSITASSLELVSVMCDIEAITKKAAEASRKASNQNLAASAAAHAAKTAAEKRATAALLTLRDAAFQRTNPIVRRSAIDAAVGIAAGRLPTTTSIEDKALKLVMNVIFNKAQDLSEAVVTSATEELERAANYAKENYEKIQNANKAAEAKKQNQDISQRSKNPLLPKSDEEKVALEHVRKPVVLFMALCVRKPEIIKKLLTLCCSEGANILEKAVRNNMPKLARAAATKYGAAKIALQVAELTDISEIPLLLSFLDNLSPSSDTNPPSQDLIDACHEIQSQMPEVEGKKDARFIIPVVSGMKRIDLEAKLPYFVGTSDMVFKASLRRMSERLSRHASIFRDEVDPASSTLIGMTLCELFVYLHRMDFAAADLPQKRYLDAIRICLEDDEIFTDRVIMAGLDYISGTFLEGASLPLAYMRTIILTCSKHESLHSWICHVLLPRLIEGRVYTDRRQWEGWMRCAKMLETSGGDSGVNSLNAIKQLPEEQYRMYRTKYPKSS